MKDKNVAKTSDGNLDFEIEFCERLLQKRPHFVQALSLLGDLYTKKGFYLKGLEVDEMLYLLKPRDPIVLYNLACSYSLLNEKDKALRSIKQAINCGYDDFCQIENDTDLDNLRSDSRFRKYFSRIKNRTALAEKA
jgi:tetratricopeptide (TPR) repeat protein